MTTIWNKPKGCWFLKKVNSEPWHTTVSSLKDRKNLDNFSPWWIYKSLWWEVYISVLSKGNVQRYLFTRRRKESQNTRCSSVQKRCGYHRFFFSRYFIYVMKLWWHESSLLPSHASQWNYCPKQWNIQTMNKVFTLRKLISNYIKTLWANFFSLVLTSKIV